MDNTNLSDMIKNEQQPVFETSNLDLPVENEILEETPTEDSEENVETIKIATLNTWFEEHASSFDNISQVKVAIRGIDPAKTLIISVLDDQGEVDGNPSRDLQVFKNADAQPVLSLPASEMQIFNNGFKIIHPYTEDIAIKCYGVRTGLICVFCHVIENKLVPYQIIKIKKKDEDIEVPRQSYDNVSAKLPQNADLETLQLLYKQSSKSIADLSTNETVLNWLLQKQTEVTDINHLMQIDNVIISLF